MKHDEKSLARLITERQRLYQDYWTNCAARRGLLDSKLAKSIDKVILGTALPAPYNKSPLRMEIVTGNAQQAVNSLTAAVAANFPRMHVYPIGIDHEKVGERVKKQAADQEKLFAHISETLRGRVKQQQTMRSATSFGVGYLFTLPRPSGFGLPPRASYPQYATADVENARKKGIVLEETEEGYEEEAESWMERRKQAAMENWAHADRLFTLDSYPADMVVPTFGMDGSMMAGTITMDIPGADLKPGAEFARSAARYAKKRGEYDGDEGDYGIWAEGGKVKCGLPAGQEPGTATGEKWTLTIYADAEEVYYLVGTSGNAEGKIIWADEHGGGYCPIQPVGFYRSDSRQPGSEYVSAADPVFRMAPPLNALWNQVVAGAGWNSAPRHAETGVARLGDPETGEQMATGVPGSDPAVQDVYEGDLTPIVVQIADTLAALQIAIEEMDKLMPSSILNGQAVGTGDTAWGLQIQVDKLLDLYEQPVGNHAEAWRIIWCLWVRWIKQMGLPVVAFPSSEKGEGLIQVDPDSLTEAFGVSQDAADAQAKTIRQQLGIEQFQGGFLDEEQLYEQFFGEDDPRGRARRVKLQRLSEFILYGDTSKIQPGSALYKVAERVQGRLEQLATEISPNAAIAQAEQMLAEARQQAMAQQQAMMQQTQPAEMGGGPQPVGPPAATLQDTLGAAAPGAVGMNA